MTNRERLHQQLSALDNEVFSAFCDSFQGIAWTADFKDNIDPYCGIDLQLTGTTSRAERTYDIELKSRFQKRLYDDCFFEYDKWYKLIYWNNDIKLYVAIYPFINKIAIWSVSKELFDKSEKDIQELPKSTATASENVSKTVYKFKFTDGKLHNFDLTPWKEQYYALYQQISEQKNKMEETFQQ